MQSSRFTVVELDARALRSNVLAFQKLLSPGIDVMPIIKSNAYGHGMLEVATVLQKMVRLFGVANSEEGLELRKKGIPHRLVVLSYAYPTDVAACIRQHIALPIFDEHSYRHVRDVAIQQRHRALVHVKIDVGTSRIGFREENTKIVQKILRDPYLFVEGIYSHYSSSEEHAARTGQQLQVFLRILQQLSPKPPSIHLACSAAALSTSLEHQTVARIGLATYGLWPSRSIQRRAPITLKPVLTWKTQLLQVKTILNGTAVGYGATFRAKRQMRIGILPCGYFEGLPRSISPNGFVLISGKRAKFLGRICMNLSMIDLSRVPSAKPGMPVILIGKSGAEKVTAEDHARWTKTISYEVVTRIHPSIPRIIQQHV